MKTKQLSARRCAIHEAGHAIVAEQLGGWANAFIFRNRAEFGQYAGLCYTNGLTSPEDEAAMIAAGMEAERLFYRGIYAGGSDGDKERLQEIAWRNTTTDDEAARFIMQAHFRAQKILKRSREKIRNRAHSILTQCGVKDARPKTAKRTKQRVKPTTRPRRKATIVDEVKAQRRDMKKRARLIRALEQSPQPRSPARTPRPTPASTASALRKVNRWRYLQRALQAGKAGKVKMM